MSVEDLAAWIRSELDKRRWSCKELARQANVSPATVYMFLNGQRSATYRFCTRIANAFGVPKERILRIAGLLSPSGVGEEEVDRKRELDDYWAYLNDGDRDTIISLVRILYERRARNRVEHEVEEEPATHL